MPNSLYSDNMLYRAKFIIIIVIIIIMHDNVYGTTRFFLMNVERRQAAAGPRLQPKPKDLRGVYSDTTQINSTSSCRHVNSVNNCYWSVLNVETQLTQFVGHDVIYDVFWRVCREMEFWSEEFEEKLIELWENMPVYMTYRPKPSATV